MPKLTKRFLDSLSPGRQEEFFWDSEVDGFGLRIFPSGRKSYVIQYRNEEGRTRRMTLGTHGRLTPTEARKLARLRLASVQHGEDPSAQRQEKRRSETLRELAERYLEQHARPKKKARSAAGDEALLHRHILPALGHLPVKAITRAEVSTLHHALRQRPFQANRVLALLSKMLNLAEAWGLRREGTNPVRHVVRYREKKRERFLSPQEFARLGETLAELEAEGREPPAVILAIRLLALTGLRRSEVLTLRWSEVDFERACLRLEDSKTGPQTIPLGAAALELLSTAPRVEGNPYVVPGKLEGSHFVGLPRAWGRIRKQAGLDGVRLHDLRHSYASVGAGAGMGLPVIGALLGHRYHATTARYAHLATDPLKEAADRISGEIAGAMGRRAKPGEAEGLGDLAAYRRRGPRG